MDGSEVGSGMVSGAWGYVIVVYVATWAVVIGLAIRAVVLARAHAALTGVDGAGRPRGGGDA
jgi:hypothetical protein